MRVFLIFQSIRASTRRINTHPPTKKSAGAGVGRTFTAAGDPKATADMAAVDNNKVK